MSTTDAPEQQDQPRPSGARRLVRTIVRVMLLVLLSLGGLLVLLHLPPVKTLVGASLARLFSGAAGAEVSFDRLDYRLWLGVASVDGLSLKRVGLDVTSERATVRLRPSGMYVEIAGTRVIVTEETELAPPLAPSRPWAVIGRFAGVIVERLSIELRDREGAAWLTASGIDGRFDRQDDRSRGTARVARADISWPGGGPRLVGARAEAAIEIDVSSEVLHLVDGRVAIGGSRLQAAGRLDQVGPMIATAKAEGRIDAPLLTEFAPAIDAEGMLDVRVSGAHDGSATTGAIEVDAPGLTFARAGPVSGALRGRFEGHRLLLDSMDLRGSNGQVSATGVVIPGEGASWLDVRARGVDIANLGSAFTGSRPPLASNADMDLRLEIENWNADTLTGSGHVSFNPGPGTGLPLSGRSAITLTRSGVNFVAPELRVHDTRLAVDGSLSFPADLAIEYTLRLPDLAEAPALLADADIRVPPLALEGSADVAGTLTGQLPDWRLDARLSTQGLAVEKVDVDLNTTLLITPAGVRISSLVGQGADGHIEASGFVPLDGESEWAVEAEVAGVQLIDALSRHAVPIQTTIDGRVQVDGPASQPRARFTVEAQAALDDDARASDGAVGAPTLVRAAGSVSHRSLVLEQATAEVAGGRVSASGSWSASDSSLEGRLSADGIAVERLPWLQATAYKVTSTLSADFSVSGTARAPVGRGSVTLTGNMHGERALPDVTLEATADGELASLNGRMGIRPFLTGTLAFRDEWPLHIEVDLAELPITELLPAVPALSKTDATVALSGRLSMDLPALAPRDVRYQANVTHLDARLRRTWLADPFTVTGDLHAFEVHGLMLAAGNLRLDVDGRAALDESVTDAVLTIRGELPLSDLAAVIPDAELEGKADLDVRVTGSVFDPALDGTLQLLAGPGRLQRLRWNDAQLRGRLADETFTLEEGRATLSRGEVSMSGSARLGLGTADRGFELRLTATGVDLAPFFVATDGPAVEPTSAVLVDLSAELAAPELTLAALDGQGQLTRLDLAAGEQAIHLEAPVTWHVRDGTLDHSPLRLRGSSSAALDVAAQMQAGQLAVRLNGQIDLAVAQPFLADTARVSGPVVLDLTLATGPDGVAVTGEGRVENGRILLREPRLAIDGLTGTLRATGARVELVDVTARVGDGQLTAAGNVTLPTTDSFGVDVNLQFDRVPLNHPEGLRSRASGTIRMAGGAGRYRLEGDVALHRAVYDRKLDRTTQSLDRVGLELAALDAGASPLQRAELDIRMRLEDGLRIENEEARLVVDGAIRIGGDLLTPDVRGTLALREGGTVELSRATLRISQGRIELDGFPAQAPELNIQGSTQVTGVLIDATISGPVDNFNLSLSSRNRSDLTQGDLASLILTGRTASDAVSDSGAIVAERLAASLGRALDTRTGSAVFIDVSRDEDLIVQDTNPSQRLNIGVPVGRNLFVIYSNALDRNAPRWTVELRPTGELRVRAISDSEDGNAIQVAHRFSFNVWSRRSIERPATTRDLRIARILFEGLNPEEEASLRRSLSLEPGGVVDYFRADESARDLRAELQRQGYAAATVEFADRDVGSGRVDVIFDVQRGPRFDIEWRGDDPGGKARRRVEEGWDSFFPVEDTAARLADELRWTLRADRYFNATVSANATVAEQMAHVIFDVRRGSRGRQVDLAFEGNDAITAEALRAALPPTDDAAFFRMLDAEGRTQLTSALRLAYAREGFLEAVAGAPVERFDAASGVLSVTIPIDEGPPARVVELDLPEDVRSSGAPPPDLQLAVGQPFRIDAYIEDRGRLVSWYREQGFTTARVTSVLAPVDDGLAVRFGVDPGPRARVGDIRVARAGHTRRSVVNDAMTLAPGDLITPSELQRSRRYLADTGVFRSVEIRPESTAPGTQDLVIDLLPRDDLTVEYNVRYTTDGNGGVGDSPSSEPSDPIQFGAAIEASNPFGFAHRYRLYGLVGGERALLGASFDAATFFGRRWRTQVFLYDDEDRVADIPRLLGHIRGGTFQQTKRWQDERAGSQWRDSLRMIWGYTHKQVHYSDSTTGQALSGERAGLIHSLIGDTRDNLTDPHRGIFWSVGTELALQTLGSDVDYAKVYGQLYYYVPLGPRVVWAQGYRVGVTPGDDPLLLLEGRFHAGGASSVRGFEENTLGPQTGDGESLGGQAVAIFNQELRFPIVKKLWGGIFYDAGNAFALTSDLALGSLRHSAGGGLRLMMPFGPVRLEHAWVLDPKGGENRSRWVFSLGHAF